MPVEIPGFSDLEREFKKRLVEEQTIREQLQGARKIALGVWEQMEKARQFALEDILKERNLGLCSRASWGHSNEESEEEQLGIFPRQQLRCLYIRGLNSDNDPELFDCCSRHYQRELDMYNKGDEFMRSRWFLSEVENREGRLVTATDSIDVTDMPIQYKVGERSMENIFQYFDLPQLPPRPAFQS